MIGLGPSRFRIAGDKIGYKSPVRRSRGLRLSYTDDDKRNCVLGGREATKTPGAKKACNNKTNKKRSYGRMLEDFGVGGEVFLPVILRMPFSHNTKLRGIQTALHNVETGTSSGARSKNETERMGAGKSGISLKSLHLVVIVDLRTSIDAGERQSQHVRRRHAVGSVQRACATQTRESALTVKVSHTRRDEWCWWGTASPFRERGDGMNSMYWERMVKCVSQGSRGGVHSGMGEAGWWNGVGRENVVGPR